MKYLTGILIALAFLSCTTKEKSGGENELSQQVTEMEKRAALRHLVDTFSILADEKDALAQTLLFTETAVVETYRDGELVSKLEGREQIGQAFGNFLSNFEIVYHFNGQHSVTLNGAKATGILYCLTTLITAEKVKTNIGVRYNDEYVFENGKWLIAKRTSMFDWQEVTELNE